MSEFPTLMSEFSASDKGFSALTSAFLTLTSHDLIVLRPHESCPSEQPQTPNPELKFKGQQPSEVLQSTSIAHGLMQITVILYLSEKGKLKGIIS
jgi:hypothetical protein